jgi:hypothetical protein
MSHLTESVLELGGTMIIKPNQTHYNVLQLGDWIRRAVRDHGRVTVHFGDFRTNVGRFPVVVEVHDDSELPQIEVEGLAAEEYFGHTLWDALDVAVNEDPTRD